LHISALARRIENLSCADFHGILDAFQNYKLVAIRAFVRIVDTGEFTDTMYRFRRREFVPRCDSQPDEPESIA